MKRVLSAIVSHHNKIQFLGYELANILLIGRGFFSSQVIDRHITLEACAAIAFMLGSLLIWFFDIEKRPTMLFFGGIGLILGGVFLTVAGYPVTGLSIVLASFESTRGGILAIIDHCNSAIERSAPASFFTRKSLRLGSFIFGWYVRIIRTLTGRFKNVGAFINTRPFLTSALIKAPLRLEFVIKKFVAGDLIGVCVGLSWMILGDGALALNDNKLKARLHAYSISGR